MPIQTLVTEPSQAFRNIRTRLKNDIDPVWEVINSRPYSPFWLLTRELFPVAESIGDLIYKDKSTNKNLVNFLDNDLSKIRSSYGGKGSIIALLYRHSLMHQDEPRSIHAENITIEWNIAFIDGRDHFGLLYKDKRRRACGIRFDLRAFYEDIVAILEMYERETPAKSIVKRYNSWTCKSYTNKATKDAVRDFYINNEEPDPWDN